MTYIQVEVRDVGRVGQHHGQGQGPDQGQHQVDGEPLLTCLPEYLISVNAEGKEAEHDGIAGEVLRKELGKDDECEDDLEHGKNKAEELAQEPVMNQEYK